MILLDTVLDKVITPNLIWKAIAEISPIILPILVVVIITKGPSGFKFCWNMIRNK